MFEALFREYQITIQFFCPEILQSLRQVCGRFVNKHSLQTVKIAVIKNCGKYKLTSAHQNPEYVTRQENWEKGRDHETQDWPKGRIMNGLQKRLRSFFCG